MITAVIIDSVLLYVLLGGIAYLLGGIAYRIAVVRRWNDDAQVAAAAFWPILVVFATILVVFAIFFYTATAPTRTHRWMQRRRETANLPQAKTVRRR